MSAARETPDFRDNLTHLQTESLKVIALFASVISYVWFVLLLWPVIDRSALTSAWIGVGLLILSAILSYVLKGDHLRLVTYLLIWGVLGAAACAMLTFQSPAVAYLFILPIIFASVLLRRRTVFLGSHCRHLPHPDDRFNTYTVNLN